MGGHTFFPLATSKAIDALSFPKDSFPATLERSLAASINKKLL
jgi:hypothetical protein